MDIEEGKIYAGEHGEGRFVRSISNGQVTYTGAVNLTEEHVCSLAEMQSWAQGLYVRPGS